MALRFSGYYLRPDVMSRAGTFENVKRFIAVKRQLNIRHSCRKKQYATGRNGCKIKIKKKYFVPGSRRYSVFVLADNMVPASPSKVLA